MTNHHVRWRTIAPWTMPMLALWLLVLLLTAVQGAAAAPSDDGPDDQDHEVRIVGVVLSTPGGADGLGDWSVAADGIIYTVRVDGDTEFHDGVPRVGQRVRVEGVFLEPAVILAHELRVEDQGDDEEGEWQGLLISKPADGNGAGIWVIRVGQGAILTATADLATRFDPADLAAFVPGIWVEIKGTPMPGGTVRATRIRIDEYEAGEVVVRLQPGAISSTVASRYGLVARSTLLADGHIYLLASPDDENEVSLVDRLQQDPDVIWAELNYVNSVPESEGYKTWGWGDRSDEYINQYAFEQVKLPAVSAYYTGTGILVAVLDTGVDLQHPDLADRLQLPGLDVVSGDTVPQDEGPPPGGAPGLAWGHGTHVAGIVARLAPGSRILPVRVLDANGRGNTFLLAYAIEWAVGQGADVINLSLGTPYVSQVLREAIQAAIDRGVVVVAAAGNNNTDTPHYPAAYADVLAVTAVDGANRKASFANYGWVDLAAPGVGITSTVIGPEGHGYGSWSGTSMAAPFVSGGAALVRTKLAQPSAAPGGRAGVLAVANRLRESARPLDADDAQYGDKLGGLLDLEAALLEQEPVLLELRLFIPRIQR